MTSVFNDKNKLIAALRAQKIVSGIDNDMALATELASAVSVKPYAVGDMVTRQGDLTDEMYFILSGKVEVLINDRHKTYRYKDETVGEMSLVDIGGTRSATIIVKDAAILARIEQQDFTKIANQFPELWRNIAKCLAGRLRQRNERERVKNPKPVIFIASSSEGKSVMDAIVQGISGEDIEVCPWTSDNLFGPSTHPIETLEKAAQEVDFAIIVLSPDDKLKFRGNSMVSPRDNVIFEQGLFVGGIGRERTFVVECAPKQCVWSRLPIIGKSFNTALKMPSDYQNLIVFRCGSSEQLPNICERIVREIKRQKTI